MKNKFKLDNVLLVFALKSIITTVVTSLLLCAVFSYIILKFDLNYMFYDIFACIIVLFTSFITANIATLSMKNNVFIMSLISNVLIILITIINVISGKNIILFAVEIIFVLLASFISSQLVLKKHRGFNL